MRRKVAVLAAMAPADTPCAWRSLTELALCICDKGKGGVLTVELVCTERRGDTNSTSRGR